MRFAHSRLPKNAQDNTGSACAREKSPRMGARVLGAGRTAPRLFRNESRSPPFNRTVAPLGCRKNDPVKDYGKVAVGKRTVACHFTENLSAPRGGHCPSIPLGGMTPRPFRLMEIQIGVLNPAAPAPGVSLLIDNPGDVLKPADPPRRFSYLTETSGQCLEPAAFTPVALRPEKRQVIWICKNTVRPPF